MNGAFGILNEICDKADTVIQNSASVSTDDVLAVMEEMTIGDEVVGAFSLVSNAITIMEDVYASITESSLPSEVQQAYAKIDGVMSMLNMEPDFNTVEYSTEGKEFRGKINYGIAKVKEFARRILAMLANAFDSFVKRYASVGAIVRRSLGKKADQLKKLGPAKGKYDMPHILIEPGKAPLEALSRPYAMYIELTKGSLDFAKQVLSKEGVDWYVKELANLERNGGDEEKVREEAQDLVRSYMDKAIRMIYPNTGLASQIEIDGVYKQVYATDMLPGGYRLAATISLFGVPGMKLVSDRKALEERKKNPTTEIDLAQVNKQLLIDAIDATIKGQDTLIKTTNDVRSLIAKSTADVEKMFREGNWGDGKVVRYIDYGANAVKAHSQNGYKYAVMHMRGLNSMVNAYIKAAGEKPAGEDLGDLPTGSTAVAVRK